MKTKHTVTIPPSPGRKSEDGSPPGRVPTPVVIVKTSSAEDVGFAADISQQSVDAQEPKRHVKKGVKYKNPLYQKA